VEQCVEFDECHLTQPFVNADKAVFVTEYSTSREAACSAAARFDLSVIIKDRDLTAAVEFCP
jgi:hypothetical protein